MFIELTESEIDIVADILANFHDWNDKDLKKAFVGYICSEIPRIGTETASYIYDKFMSISAPVRFGSKFNHKEFVYKVLS